ncbi:hypothetical protein LTR16_012174, partial [Cryomyces antarcticus]
GRRRRRLQRRRPAARRRRGDRPGRRHAHVEEQAGQGRPALGRGVLLQRAGAGARGRRGRGRGGDEPRDAAAAQERRRAHQAHDARRVPALERVPPGLLHLPQGQALPRVGRLRHRHRLQAQRRHRRHPRLPDLRDRADADRGGAA